MDKIDIDRLVWRGSWMSEGKPPLESDYPYWEAKWPELEARGIETHVTDYGFKRILGWQKDPPPSFGEYAVPPTPYHDAPAFPQDPPAHPVVVPVVDPVPVVTIVDLTGIEDRLDRIERVVAVGDTEILKRLDSLRTEFLTSVRQLAASGIFARLFGR